MSKSLDFKPQWVSTPGDTITDILRERQLSLTEFARLLAAPLEAVTALLEGRASITIAIARRLQETLGASVEFWMTRDFQYREDMAKREKAEATHWLSELPIGDMIKFGWLPRPPHPSEELATCLNFFDVPNVEAWRTKYSNVRDSVLYRTSRSLDSRPGSVATWLRRGEVEAVHLRCSAWNPDAFRNCLDSIRALTRNKDPRRFVPELQTKCAKCGVAVAVVRAPAGCRASGATQFLSEERALLLLSSRFLSDDQFWFTFFHEAGHLILHAHRRLILEGLNSTADVEEKQADAFAEAMIVPAHAQPALLRLRANSDQVIRFARSIGISPGVVVGQLQHHGALKPNQLNGLKRRFVWTDTGLAIRERL